MGRYNVHPAQGRGHYHDNKNYKDHSPTLDQLKEKAKKTEEENEKVQRREGRVI